MFDGPLRAAAVAACLVLPQIAASAVICNQAANGDALPGESAPVLAQTPGTNDILGTVTCGYSGPDFDAYTQVVGADQGITSFVFSQALHTFESSDWFRASSTGFHGGDAVPTTSSGLSLFASAMPRGLGSESLVNRGFCGSLFPGDFRTAGRSIIATVADALSPVPLPGAGDLLAVSLEVPGALRRRRTYPFSRSSRARTDRPCA